MSRSPVLPVFAADAPRYLPRDKGGRFIAVRHSAQRRKILAVARAMRARLKLPPLPALECVDAAAIAGTDAPYEGTE